MKTIFIVNKASKAIGLGHMMRCKTLADYIYFSCSYNLDILTYGDSNIKSCVYQKDESKNLGWYVQNEINFDWLDNYVGKKRPSLVVIDCGNDSQNLIRYFHSINICTLVLDYYDVIKAKPNIIINLFRGKADAFNKLINADNFKRYDGEKYAIIRNEFLLSREKKNIKNQSQFVNNILVSFGGSDPSNNSLVAIKTIMNFFSGITLNVILGPLFDMNKIKLRASDRKKNKIELFKSPENFSRLLEESDLIFCGAGTTLLEALCVGIPAIVFPQNQEELEYAMYLAKKNICILSHEVNWNSIMHFGFRQNISSAASAFIDGRGKERISYIIDQQIKLLANFK